MPVIAVFIALNTATKVHQTGVRSMQHTPKSERAPPKEKERHRASERGKISAHTQKRRE